jgi:hypothetical protein
LQPLLSFPSEAGKISATTTVWWMKGSAEGADRKEEETVAQTDDREAQVDEKDVEAHSTIDSPAVDSPSIDRTDDDADDVEGHVFIDKPAIDKPAID